MLQQGAHPSSDHRVQGLLAVSKYLLASATAGKQAANSVSDGLLVSIKDEHGPEVQINLIFQLAMCTRQQGLGSQNQSSVNMVSPIPLQSYFLLFHALLLLCSQVLPTLG